jgi:RNA polymerase sigma-70 factor (ECF subfamily)
MPSRERTEQERKLRQQVLAGDESAWRTLYDGAFVELWNYVSWRCAGLHELVEEITQETWLIAVRRLRDFDPHRATFVTWLRGIASHLLYNQFRASRHRRQRSLSDPAFLEPAHDDRARREQAQLIAEALAELPPRYEAVLRAKYLDLASVADIAGEWNETPKAIESLLTRARQAFRVAYEKLSGNDVLVQELEP